jgi:hypothetical protein
LIVVDLHQRPDYSKRRWWQNKERRSLVRHGERTD